MNKINTRTLFLGLFAVLYLSVAIVSTFHAFSFFGLANNGIMAAMLAGTFEIGQAAVLFSLLTDSSNRQKAMPWVLMCILTAVQVLGNVYSSYEYIITNSMEHLKYFKEPIFIWTDLPDAQANVIVTYIQGSLLPIICLLLTSMVTNYLDKTDKKSIDSKEKSKESTEQENTNIANLETKNSEAQFPESKEQEAEELENTENLDSEAKDSIVDVDENTENLDSEVQSVKQEVEELENTDIENSEEQDPTPVKENTEEQNRMICEFTGKIEEQHDEWCIKYLTEHYPEYTEKDYWDYMDVLEHAYGYLHDREIREFELVVDDNFKI